MTQPEKDKSRLPGEYYTSLELDWAYRQDVFEALRSIGFISGQLIFDEAGRIKDRTPSLSYDTVPGACRLYSPDITHQAVPTYIVTRKERIHPGVLDRVSGGLIEFTGYGDSGVPAFTKLRIHEQTSAIRIAQIFDIYDNEIMGFLAHVQQDGKVLNPEALAHRRLLMRISFLDCVALAQKSKHQIIGINVWSGS